MFDMVIGIAIGAVFAPFWMMLWNTFVMPALVAVKNWVMSKIGGGTPPPAQ